MTKQDYIQLRSTNQIDLGLAYQMYMSVLPNEPKITPHLFNQVFPIYVNMLNGDMTNYYAYWDQHFGVNMLIKKDGNVIFC